jgi:GNAT superfamily N-acetyltransferase
MATSRTAISSRPARGTDGVAAGGQAPVCFPDALAQDHRALQSHGRSMLIWPDVLDDATATEAVRTIIGVGARVIWLGSPRDIDRVIPGVVRRTLPLHRRRHPRPDAEPVPVRRLEARSATTHARIVQLQRSRSITPLPAHAFADTAYGAAEWDHWVIERDETLVGVIQRQILKRPLPGVGTELALVCGLAVRADAASRGFGRALLEHAAASDGTGSAICISDPDLSTEYLIRQGWELTGATVELVAWR